MAKIGCTSTQNTDKIYQANPSIGGNFFVDKDLKEYRSILIEGLRKAQDSFDKTVLTLSGGALGVSFAFVKDIVGKDHLISGGLLLASWASWGLSMACILASFYFSQKAQRKAVNQIDEEKIYVETPGGMFSKTTEGLNIAGGLSFLLGLVFMIIFTGLNFLIEESWCQLRPREVDHARKAAVSKKNIRRKGVRSNATATAPPACATRRAERPGSATATA